MNRDEFYSALDQNRSASLQHHGILGQKWGVRRYQNPDGTLTAAGKARQQKLDSRELKKAAGDVREANTIREAMGPVIKKYGDQPIVNGYRLMADADFEDSLDKYEQLTKSFIEKYGQKSLDKLVTDIPGIAKNAVAEANDYLNERGKSVDIGKHKNVHLSTSNGGDKHVEQFKKNYDEQKVIKQVVSEFYDNAKREGWFSSNMSRNEFIKSINLEAVHISDSNGKGVFEISFTSPAAFGGHSMDCEGSIDDMNIKYFSLNG